MSFRIFFSEPSGDQAICSLTFCVGPIKVSSPPQNVSDHYRDLRVMLSGMISGNLNAIFICNEPLININHKDDRLENLFVFVRDDEKIKKISVQELRGSIIHCLDGSLAALTMMLMHMKYDLSEIDEDIKTDILDGVYAPFHNYQM